MNIPQKIRLPGISKILAIMSGKGGTGKTFVATNLAVLLAGQGKRIGLLDANISCPDVFRALGITSKITPTADNKIIPAEKFGVKAVSMAGLCATEDEPIVWRGPILSKIIQQLLKETVWGELDMLIIDLPPGTSDASITILQQFEIDYAIVVTTPQMLATVNARRAANAAYMLKIPVLGVVENMRGEIFGEGGGSRIAELLHIPFLGSIPMKKQITAFTDAGKPAVLEMEEFAMLFSRIARAVTEQTMVE